MILTAAGLVVTLIGSVNRIVLSRLLGGEGIGLYQMAYPAYMLLLAISAAGLPVAISILVAEQAARNDHAGAQRIFKVSLALMSCIGLALAALLFGTAGWLAGGVLADGRAYHAMVALTPAVFISTVIACFRGFFQGYQLMTPTAVSQICEQFVRVTAMLLLALYFLPQGLEYAAAGAAFGAVPGGLAGLAVLLCFYLYYRKAQRLPGRGAAAAGGARVTAVAKRLAFLALPVSCANILVPLSSGVDMLLVPNRLVAAGFAVDEATAMFGYLAGMAQPLLMLATIPSQSLAASLVPAVAEAFTLGERAAIQRRAAVAMKLCCLLTIPASVGMSVFAEPVARLLYGTAQAGVAIANAGPSICLLGMQQISTGILQGIGRVRTPMWNMAIGLVGKVAALWLLTDAVHHIAGAAWATNLYFGLTAALNIRVLCQCGIFFPWRVIIKTALAAAMMGAAGLWGYPLLTAAFGSNNFTALAALLLAVLLYVILLFCLRIVAVDELPLLQSVPGVRKKG